MIEVSDGDTQGVLRLLDGYAPIAPVVVTLNGDDSTAPTRAAARREGGMKAPQSNRLPALATDSRLREPASGTGGAGVYD